jgi:hypothetical protein
MLFSAFLFAKRTCHVSARITILVVQYASAMRKLTDVHITDTTHCTASQFLLYLTVADHIPWVKNVYGKFKDPPYNCFVYVYIYIRLCF